MSFAPVAYPSGMIEYFVTLSRCSCFRLKHFVDFFKNRRALRDLNDLAHLFWDEPLLQRQIFEVSQGHSLKDDIEFIERHAIQILYPGHPEYPLEFFVLEKPPLFLYVRGTLPRHSVKLGVVGAREISEETEIWLRRHLSEVLDKKNLCTVSGGARGVDRYVHDLSRFYQRPTVVFLPSGHRSVYPQDLKREIPKYLDAGGAVVSEFSLDTPMRKHHFLQRNRMIASYSSHLLIAEAKIKGGTMTTAEWAIRCGTNLAVIPQSPLLNCFEGNLQLLVDGATPVRDSTDLELFIDRGLRASPVKESAPNFFERD